MSELDYEQTLRNRIYQLKTDAIKARAEGYRAGQEAMRERAASAPITKIASANSIETALLMCANEIIRALPIQEELK